MQCEGNFIFKAIEKRDGGEFTNDRGDKITYDDYYRITVDEVKGDKITQRFFKFPIKNKALFEKFENLKPYEDILIVFDIELYISSVKLVPVDLVVEHEGE